MPISLCQDLKDSDGGGVGAERQICQRIIQSRLQQHMTEMKNLCLKRFLKLFSPFGSLMTFDKRVTNAWAQKSDC